MSDKIDRRSFLEKTGVMVGGVSLAAMAAFSTTSCQKGKPLPLNLPKDKIRLGMIGTGQRFIKQITEALKYLPNFELIACADLIPNRLENGLTFAAKGAKGYKDYRALLDNKDVDAVVVCTPLVSHFQIASDALNAGKHVICEKTMTYSIEEAMQLEKLVLSNPKLKFRVSHEYRKNPTINKVKEIVQNGVLGKVTQVYSKWDEYTDWRREVTDPEFAELINWRLHRKYCGGLMTEMITHLVDNVNYILDSHPIKAMSTGSISFWKDERDTFDNVHTTYEYPNDIQASFGSNRACTYERPYLKIYGDKATIEVQFRGKNTAQITPNPSIADGEDAVDAISSASYKLFEKSDKKNIIIENDLYASYNDLMYSFFSDTLFGYKHFIDMIVNDVDSDISVTDGKKTAITVLMANLSNRNNTIELWKPEYGE